MRRPFAAGACLAPLLLAGCATVTPSPGPSIVDTLASDAAATVVEGKTVLDIALTRFAKDLFASANANADDSRIKAENAFRSGRAVIDMHCQSYLDAIGIANQAAGHERKQVGLVGGLASAVMGLAGSPAKAIAGVATGFSFAGSSLDARSTSYLFSDAASSITKIVRESQATWLAAADLSDLDFADAVYLLAGYESLCRPAEIRARIDQAIAAGTVVAQVAQPQPGDFEVLAVVNALSATFGRPIVEAEATVLYTWYVDPAQRPAIAKIEPVPTLKGTDADPAFAAKLRPAFAPLALSSSPVARRWKDAVAQLLQAPKAVPPVAGVASAGLQPGAASAVEPSRTKRRAAVMPVLTVR